MAVYDQKPIRVMQDGIRYDGSLEAHWAECLRVHSIRSIYHPGSIDFGNGMIYSPDFLLTDFRMFAEVKRELTGQDLVKLQGIAEQLRKSTVILRNDGLLQMYECADPAWGGMGLRYPHEVYLAFCHDCGSYYFGSTRGSQRCRRCGYWDGTTTSTILFYGDGERGKVADPRKYFASTSYASDRGKPHHKPLYEPGRPAGGVA